MGATVLVIDDSQMVRHEVRTALSGAGFSIVEAQDGIDALQKLGATDVNLVVCDINMPRMNGIDFLEQMKKDARPRRHAHDRGPARAHLARQGARGQGVDREALQARSPRRRGEEAHGLGRRKVSMRTRRARPRAFSEHARAIGRLVRRARLRRGWSQRELALRLGVGVATLQRIEAARGNPSLRLLVGLARTLAVRLGDLVAGA
jgi:CheY-like chemotaxis protein/DNA-binding XRE family transcriptional regulator